MDMIEVFSVVCLFVGTVSATYEVKIPEKCFQKPETGNCRAKIPMWFHNSTSNKCEQFIYGGCPGSDNRFGSREDCISSCQPGICFEPVATGPCKANIRLWYYDSTHHRCNQFTYGGCGGNENKFGTEHACHLACGESNQVCPLSKKFQTVARKPVKADFMEQEIFMYYCGKRCKDWCKESHSWGHCLSYSVERLWYGCYCYIFNRYLSNAELDHTTQGQTWNRLCEGK